MLVAEQWKHAVRASLCFLGLAATALAHADVAIGTQKISTGTEIKVLEPGPDLQDIIDGITDEAPDKPYVLKLGPGVFDVSPHPDTGAGLVMAPHISLVGSGQDITILRGAISAGVAVAESAIVRGASETLLADLSVENTGGGSLSVAVYNTGGAAPRIKRVRVTASGGTVNYGFFNSGSSPTMIAVTAAASGGTTSYGVYNSNSSPAMTEITANASGGDNNYGVYNSGSSSAMTEIAANASGGTNNYAVFNGSSSSPTIAYLIATASGGTSFNYGVYNNSSSAPQIRNSLLSGETDAVGFNGSSGTRIANSQLVGGIDADPDIASDQCRNTFDENLGDVAC